MWNNHLRKNIVSERKPGFEDSKVSEGIKKDKRPTT